MDRPKTALCLIVWNQRQGCEHDLPKIDCGQFDEVFAVDGGSVDGTVGVLERHGVRVCPQPRRSLNAAYWHAVEMTRCDNVVVFFPKGSLETEIIYEIKRRLLDGFDLVVPTRVAHGAHNEEDEKLFRPRKWGVQVLARLASMLWRREGAYLSDALHGVKGFTRSAFLRMSPSASGVTIDLEMTVRSYRLRLNRCEFPVREVERSWNKTHFKVLPTSVRLARFLWAELWRRAPRPTISWDT